MNDTPDAEEDRIEAARAKLLEAALPHVPFDGWSSRTLDAAIADSGIDPGLAAVIAPRGGIDLATAFHRAGDRRMSEDASALDLGSLRYSERVARLVRLRIEIAAENREAVRRGVTLFSLPGNSLEGGRLIWGTSDAIWTALGDTSNDYNWYTKRAILSGVYTSTVLYWLGDQSEGAAATWSFLDRRIEDVMRFEKTKARLRESAVARAVFAGPRMLLDRIRPLHAAPAGPPAGFPGRSRAPRGGGSGTD